MKKLSDWMHNKTNGLVALSSLLVFLLFTALVLPRQASRSEASSGDADSPDTSFYYNADNLYQMAEAYGEAGRRAYIEARFTFDLIWPVVYTLFLATGLSWVYRRAFELDTPWQRVNLVPVLGAMFDYLENVSTSLVMVRYPSGTPVVDGLAGVFTVVKWVFVSGSFVLLLAGGLIGLWRWVIMRNSGIDT